MIYEYKLVTLQLTDEQKQVMQMGIGNIEQLNVLLLDVLNSNAKDDWEPLYPFSVPQVWFRREQKNVVKKRKSS